MARINKNKGKRIDFIIYMLANGQYLLTKLMHISDK